MSERFTLLNKQIFFIPVILAIAFCSTNSTLGQTHPSAFITREEALLVKKKLTVLPLLKNSYEDIKKQVDVYIGKDVDVPVPKDPAGGYTHDKHKNNYNLMFNSGILYQLTGNNQYALLVKNMLLKYAKLVPTLKNHPESTGPYPGRLFWQALNDANWMVYAGMAYDLIRTTLSKEDQLVIEHGAFKPEVDYFTKDMSRWFNLLHNHSVWACAGVGIIGIATNNTDYLDMALYGTAKDGKRGFIAQMDHLFSPDGYYTEGPYYLRYAILPFVLFANALNNNKPELNIFSHRDSILKKALTTCLQQTNLNGGFFPVNDALKEKDFTSNEIMTAVNICSKVYDIGEATLVVAKKQNRVLLNQGGLTIASAITTRKNIPAYYPYTTIESTDGVDGNEGGLSIIRNGKGNQLTSLIFKYTSQGMGHGHFDKLNINLFDKGREILQDYGSARFIGIEQKYGGRYLPENNSYASQTIAHNTLVVDEKSHFGANADLGEKYHSDKLYSSVDNPNVQVVAANEENAYKGVSLQRTIYLLQLPDKKKFVVDVFYAASAISHQYDLPFQYNGQFIQTSFKYQPSLKLQQTLGDKNGYQFLWKEAAAKVADTTIYFTFLNDKNFYSISSFIKDTAEIYFTRTGANDPNFNLRREPAYIIRKKGQQQLFVNVIQIHGDYDPVNEFSLDAYPAVKNIQVLQHDDKTTIVDILIDQKKLQIRQANMDIGKHAKHTVQTLAGQVEWEGPVNVKYDGKKL